MSLFIKLFLLLFFLSFNSYLYANEDKPQHKYFVGKPYKIKGVWYYPKENINYKDTGIANVYDKKIKTKKTINNELYQHNLVSAAHKTLPLPTFLRVTNLLNGYAINVRVNDRGPKDNAKIIMLSPKAAEYLKIKNSGMVELEILPNLSFQEYQKLKNQKTTNENLEKVDDLKKPTVENENLMNTADNEEKNIKKNVLKKKKVFVYNLNFEKKKIKPKIIRIKIGNFTSFDDANNLKHKLKPIYNKILLSLSIVDNQKNYSLKTTPIDTIAAAEKMLLIIHKKGYKNAKIVIENKKYNYD